MPPLPCEKCGSLCNITNCLSQVTDLLPSQETVDAIDVSNKTERPSQPRAIRFCWVCGGSLDETPHTNNYPCAKPNTMCTFCYHGYHLASIHYVTGDARDSMRNRFGVGFRFKDPKSVIVPIQKRKQSDQPSRPSKKPKKLEQDLESDSN